MKFLKLSKGKFAIVSDSDYKYCSQFKWTATRNPDGRRPGSRAKWYAKRLDGKRCVYLHRDLMKTPHGLIVNHKCANGLDCRRKNMENTTQAENVAHSYQPKEDCLCWNLTKLTSKD